MRLTTADLLLACLVFVRVQDRIKVVESIEEEFGTDL